jgi:presenilin-like A22 family membrane protease
MPTKKVQLPKPVREKLKKRQTKKQFWDLFFMQSTLFLLVSFFTITAARQILSLTQSKVFYLPETTLQDFVFSFLLATAAILLVVFYKKGAKWKGEIYKGFFLVAAFAGGMALLQLFMPIYVALVVMAALLLVWVKKSTILAHNALMVLAFAGTAAFLGSELATPNVIIVMLLFAAYDFVAVYYTKHMVVMAKEMIDQNVVLGFIIPKTVKEFELPISKTTFGGSNMILGGGDVVFPAMLIASVASQDIVKAVIIMLFALAGSFASYWIFSTQEEKQPIPALPPIVLVTLLGYLVTLFW